MNIDITGLVLITIGFILFSIIGTVTHEYGHIVVAQSLGYKTTLHYGSMNYDNTALQDRVVNLYHDNKIQIENGIEFEQQSAYEKGRKKLTQDALLVRLGGPLQTMFTGVFGLLLLYWRRKKVNQLKLGLVDWLGVFLSLFWLREVFNVVTSIMSEIIRPNGSYFGGDEKRIAELLNIWEGTLSVLLGFIGLLVALVVIFRIVPKQLRLTFILGGLLGGITGFILWMYILGPLLLP